MKKEIKFETALQRLEYIVEQLESGETSLDESIKIFEEGNSLIKLCINKLNQAEKKINKITSDADGTISIEEFE
jgi:exodeoxyribonuclease VII small subunit